MKAKPECGLRLTVNTRLSFFIFIYLRPAIGKQALYFLIMGKKKQKKKSVTVAQALQRKLAKQQGFYDGRFKEKTVRDKKKEWKKMLSRKKVKLNEEL